ncbi:MAG: hypothetical protein ACRC91_15450 [Aeromonas sp.]
MANAAVVFLISVACQHVPDDALQRVQQNRFECTLRYTIFPNADQE